MPARIGGIARSKRVVILILLSRLLLDASAPDAASVGRRGGRYAIWRKLVNGTIVDGAGVRGACATCRPAAGIDTLSTMRAVVAL
jgi:hypothetical protein